MRWSFKFIFWVVYSMWMYALLSSFLGVSSRSSFHPSYNSNVSTNLWKHWPFKIVFILYLHKAENFDIASHAFAMWPVAIYWKIGPRILSTGNQLFALDNSYLILWYQNSMILMTYIFSFQLIDVEANFLGSGFYTI